MLQLFRLQTALRDANIAIYGGERSCKYLSLPAAPSPKHEYGTAALTLELVDNMEEAIDHLHANGSGHTECIVTGDTASPVFHSAGIGVVCKIESALMHVQTFCLIHLCEPGASL